MICRSALHQPEEMQVIPSCTMHHLHVHACMPWHCTIRQGCMSSLHASHTDHVYLGLGTDHSSPSLSDINALPPLDLASYRRRMMGALELSKLQSFICEFPIEAIQRSRLATHEISCIAYLQHALCCRPAIPIFSPVAHFPTIVAYTGAMS